jgi:hypothetical protein
MMCLSVSVKFSREAESTGESLGVETGEGERGKRRKMRLI